LIDSNIATSKQFNFNDSRKVQSREQFFFFSTVEFQQQQIMSSYGTWRERLLIERVQECKHIENFACRMGTAGAYVRSRRTYLERARKVQAQRAKTASQKESGEPTRQQNAKDSSSSSLSSDVNTSEVFSRYAFEGMHCVFDLSDATEIQENAASSSSSSTSNSQNVIKNVRRVAVGALCLVFAHDERERLAVGCTDGSIRLLRVPKKAGDVVRLIHRLDGHEKEVHSVQWSLSNDVLASASLDGHCRIWRPLDGTLLRSVGVGSGAALYALAFHPLNGNVLLLGGARHVLSTLNVSTGKVMHDTEIGSVVTAIVCEPRGKLVYVGDSAGAVHVFRLDAAGTSVLLSSARVANARIASLAYRFGGPRRSQPLLLVAAHKNHLALYCIGGAGGRLARHASFPLDAADAKRCVRAAFCPLLSPRYLCIVSGSQRPLVNIFHVGATPAITAKPVTTLYGHASSVVDVAWNYDESLLASTDVDGLLLFWKRE
jgi:WD40 repeat protein